jgi:histidyl-tRNA synthetase
MKAADRSGARYALVAGERDLAENVVQLKDLVSGEQSPVAVDQIIPTIKEKLS